MKTTITSNFFFHREQRIKKLEARNAIYRPKGPREDRRHLLEYVLAKLRTCRPEWGPDPMGSSVMSLRNEQVVKIVFCFVFKTNIVPRLQVIIEFVYSYHYHFRAISWLNLAAFFWWWFSVFLWKTAEISCFCRFFRTRVTHAGLFELIWYCKLFWFVSSHDVLIWKALTNAKLVSVSLVEREHCIARRKVENLAIR